MRDFQDKIVFLTGASRGIGRAAALELGRRRATIAVGYRRDEDAAQQVAREIEDSGGRALPIALDVGDPESRDRAFDRVAAELGGLDVFVANAAATAFKPLLEVR